VWSNSNPIQLKKKERKKSMVAVLTAVVDYGHIEASE
jgi:hypothetical protein